LANVFSEYDINNVDFLKIDVEGVDYFVLKGVDWSVVAPDAILCEYEDNKTLHLGGGGYSANDMAEFLCGLGYKLFVSEWYPIMRYGARHSFKRLLAYPCEIDSSSWGNLIAFKEDIAADVMRQAYIANIGFPPNIKKRMFLVNGPTQALNVISIINDARDENSQVQDFAILGNFSVKYEENEPIKEATRLILDLHKWTQIKDITDKEAGIGELYGNGRYSACMEAIYNAIGIGYVDELYMINNSRGPLTIMMGRSYESGKIVIYGDAFGIIDSAFGNGFARIDEIVTFLPIEYSKGFLNCFSHRFLSKEILSDTINQFIASSEKLREALDYLKDLTDAGSVILATVQFAEWDMMDLNHEVDMYVKAVERNCAPGSKVFIKEHPRCIIKKRITLLTESLSEKGYKCVHIHDDILRFIPIEVLCSYIPFQKIISTASTSGITVKYLYGCSVDFGVDTEDIWYFKRGDYLRIFIDGMRNALKNLDTWDLSSPLYSFDVSPHNFYETEDKPKKIQYSNEKILTELLLKYYLKGLGTADFFKEKGMKKIALYGIGVVGKIIAHDLSKDDDIKLFLVDKNLAGQTFLNREIYKPDNFKEEIDAVLIAVGSGFEDIKEMLKKEWGVSVIFTLYDLI
jgi:hypothetical protein